MSKTFLLFGFIFLIISCTRDTYLKRDERLQILSEEAIIQKLKLNQFNYVYANFKTLTGYDLAPHQVDSLNRGLYGLDYYANDRGMIKEVRIRPFTNEDRFINAMRRLLLKSPMKKFQDFPIDCDSSVALYEAVIAQQTEPLDGLSHFNQKEIENGRLVTVLIANCGWELAHIDLIFTAILQSPPNVIAYFYLEIRKMFEQGLIQQEDLEKVRQKIENSIYRRARYNDPPLNNNINPN